MPVVRPPEAIIVPRFWHALLMLALDSDDGLLFGLDNECSTKNSRGEGRRGLGPANGIMEVNKEGAHKDGIAEA